MSHTKLVSRRSRPSKAKGFSCARCSAPSGEQCLRVGFCQHRDGAEPLRPLFLNLMGKWFDQILSGEKTEEFRLHSETWAKRLIDRRYSKIILMRGYPANHGVEGVTRLTREWRGVRVIPEFTHPHFGDDPVAVIAVDVSVPLENPDAA